MYIKQYADVDFDFVFTVCDNAKEICPIYPKAKQLIHLHKPDLFISGHSHILKVINDKTNNLLHINPGAAGLQVLHQVSTVNLWQLEDYFH